MLALNRFLSCSLSRFVGPLMLLSLAACTAPKPHRAPVEDRVGVAVAARPPSVSVEPRAPAEPSRAGTYVVKAGDTLIRVAYEHGVSHRDLARWNALDNPNLIEVGQVLRVVPPGAITGVDGLSTRPVAAGRPEAKPVELKPLDAKATDGKRSAMPSGGASNPATPALAAASAASPPAATAPTAAGGSTAPVGAEGEPQWAWPAPGTVVAGFDEVRNKGIGIGGKAGDAVLAAADGRVMYAGSGLRGYGNMVIIKHSDTYLSAYAHNQSVLVKEDQLVRKGQRIAEMGSSDTDQVKLHFEIRRKGSPIDPTKLLPPR